MDFPDQDDLLNFKLVISPDEVRQYDNGCHIYLNETVVFPQTLTLHSFNHWIRVRLKTNSKGPDQPAACIMKVKHIFYILTVKHRVTVSYKQKV